MKRNVQQKNEYTRKLDRPTRLRRLKRMFLISMLVPLTLLVISYGSYRAKKRAAEAGERVTVTVSDVDCGPAGRKSSFSFMMNGLHRQAHVPYHVCASMEQGQQVNVIYSRNDDLYYYPELGYDDEEFGIGIAALFTVLGIFLYTYAKRNA
mgnify:CR=1 FL=1